MVKEKISNSIYGLVLAGGKSLRMGHDKGSIEWHGEEQRYYLADLLSKYCDKVFISIRPEQKNGINSKYKTIIDSHKDLGQYGAILSALEKYPDKAFLVVACDLPLINREALVYLTDNRDPDKMATAYKSDSDDLPEPLAAIWEAKSKERLLELLDTGVTCPRKALIRSSHNVKLIKPLYSELTMNINTPDEAKKAQEIINKKGESTWMI